MEEERTAPRWTLRRIATAGFIVAFVAVQVGVPTSSLARRWASGDNQDIHRFSWHMYSSLDRYRGN